MKTCDGRGTSYKNGNSYEDCKKIAEDTNMRLKPLIKEKATWIGSNYLMKLNMMN